jgi:hypothetical protein
MFERTLLSYGFFESLELLDTDLDVTDNFDLFDNFELAAYLDLTEFFLDTFLTLDDG